MRIFLSFFVLFAFAQGGLGQHSVPLCSTLISDRDLETILKELHGGDPFHPTSRSRIGRYLRATGAASAVKYFRKNRRGDRGERKLVVAVSPETFREFKKLFGDSYPNALEHLHTPRQGTLMVRWMTQTFSYARPHGVWRFPTVGSIGPMIALADSEARRLHSYWVLNQDGHSQTWRQPWNIPGYNYPVDAYGSNCTAWFGHIPLGDATESEITSPGSIDQWGDGQGRAARKGTLARYSLRVAQQGPQLSREEELAMQVWTAPLHARLFTLLGIPFEKANHTNPGWVALSLTGLAKAHRVPFVIYYTEDHTKIPRQFDSQIELVGGH